MERKIVESKGAPAAIGAYSQAVVYGGTVYVSGQIPYTAEGNPVAGDLKAQTHQVMKNLKAILEEANSGLGKVLKATIYAKSMDDFALINEVYAEYFKENPPARAFVEVARLPKDVAVEIDAIAAVN